MSFPDPLVLSIGILKETVSADSFSDQRANTHGGSHVQVNVDGGSVVYPVTASPVIRVTTWAATKGQAYDLADECQSALLASSTDAIPRFDGGGFPIADVDPDTGDCFATFTVTAVLRAAK